MLCPKWIFLSGGHCNCFPIVPFWIFWQILVFLYLKYYFLTKLNKLAPNENAERDTRHCLKQDTLLFFLMMSSQQHELLQFLYNNNNSQKGHGEDIFEKEKKELLPLRSIVCCRWKMMFWLNEMKTEKSKNLWISKILIY